MRNTVLALASFLILPAGLGVVYTALAGLWARFFVVAIVTAVLAAALAWSWRATRN